MYVHGRAESEQKFEMYTPRGTYRKGRSSGRRSCRSLGRRPVPSVSAWHARHVPRRVRISPLPSNFSPPAIADNRSSWRKGAQSQVHCHASVQPLELLTRPGLNY